ncbi:MAG TPA: ATP-binding protein [Prolixibacteraceae bacterium]|nr:ATP-binding protein [Prolixibacteraceae bacterium]
MIELKFMIEGGDFDRAGTASSETKKILKQLNIDPKVIKRAVVALYEGEVNIAAHAFRGVVNISVSDHRILAVLKDEGPGIDDISRAMLAGFSTASPKVREMGFGAGMGLPNMKKNADELLVESIPGKGTTVKMIFDF